MISIHELTLGYHKDQPIIEALNLQLATGQIHGLVGRNGTGKTTLLNALHGMLPPFSGKMLLDDKPISKRDIAFLPTENYFYPNITGEEYLALFPNSGFLLDGWNELFHLPLKEIIDGYSTGMKKKLAILGVLKLDKPVIILDEPFNGLDLETGRVLHTILTTLKSQQKTILITSHILESLVELCDEIHYLNNGAMVKNIQKVDFESFKSELYDQMAKETKSKIDTLLLT